MLHAPIACLTLLTQCVLSPVFSPFACCWMHAPHTQVGARIKIMWPKDKTMYSGEIIVSVFLVGVRLVLLPLCRRRRTPVFSVA
jgi:hypothetical protein